jgi:hypothetical protein
LVVEKGKLGKAEPPLGLRRFVETSHLLYVKRFFLELEQDGPVSKITITHFW